VPLHGLRYRENTDTSLRRDGSAMGLIAESTMVAREMKVEFLRVFLLLIFPLFYCIRTILHRWCMGSFCFFSNYVALARSPCWYMYAHLRESEW
jgi:hypothetical protein